jgi:hypothetical protein
MLKEAVELVPKWACLLFVFLFIYLQNWASHLLGSSLLNESCPQSFLLFLFLFLFFQMGVALMILNCNNPPTRS